MKGAGLVSEDRNNGINSARYKVSYLDMLLGMRKLKVRVCTD